ncbi:sulfurtransferase complex subunit TusD [Umboniibacter marinipuniceus]|uniref:tRNA 2-thiouridine synthesizing protein D n=1 Tax=Umboniibacter marinipuniceus TaxID=569599 RepID=A0A3M0A8Y9_9GAMM|nr:sulfurtransferase complex subunit TusD [Umboniibacter marinipuniceus]RMA81076.1 tRNA 2-thiouridine synthesizing protein D [Umboniibacter marinipuniceus]
MKFSLLISCAPQLSEMHHNALSFAQAVLDSGHTLESVFFWGEGTSTALKTSVSPRDEHDAATLWRDIAALGGTDLNVCIASATRRGILNKSEAKRHDLPDATVASGFNIVGLGALIEAELSADRVVRF